MTESAASSPRQGPYRPTTRSDTSPSLDQTKTKAFLTSASSATPIPSW
jgi:hypothetical protein